MDPLSIGLAVAGFGLQLFGGLGAADKSKQAAQVSQGIAADEQRINIQKQQQMQLEGRRMQLEQVRNAQRLGAQATAAATNQGAMFGSGLSGGLAQISDQAGTNELGINQNQEIGRNIFGINNDISGKKQQLAQIQGEAATDQGLMSLGGSLVKAGPTIGALGKGFSLDNLGSSLMGGGSPSGYGRG